MDSPTTLLDAAGIRIDDQNSAGFTVRVARQFGLGIVALVLVSLIFVVAVVLTAGDVALCIYFPPDNAVPAVGIICLFIGMALLAWGGTIVTTLMALRLCFDRVMKFDLQRQELRLSNIPLFSRNFLLSRISAVVICSGTVRGTRMVWLCLEIEGAWRKLLIQSATPTTRDQKELVKVLVSAGETISRLTKVPFRKEARAGLLEISFI
jgi:hypothetical protein